jgi:hypothetical protein
MSFNEISQNTQTVFVLQHVYEKDSGEEEIKFIGVYTSAALAKEAIVRLQDLPGFQFYPEGFVIDQYPINQDHWTEGFDTLSHIYLKTNDSEDIDMYQIAYVKLLPGDIYEIYKIDGDNMTLFKVGDCVKCETKELKPGLLGSVAINKIQ